MGYYKKLVEYFKKTSKEKIDENWEKIKDFDNVGITIEEFSKYLDERKKENLKNK